MNCKSLFAALVAVVVLTVPSVAQDDPSGRDSGERGERGPRGGWRRGGGPGGPGGGGRFGGPGGGPMGSPIMLLRAEEVREELQIMPDQLDALKMVEQSMRPNFSGGKSPREMSDEERREFFSGFRERMEERAKDADSKIEEILMPNQMDRLKEIHLQAQGARALTNPDVTEALGLSDDQINELTEVQRSLRSSMRDRFREAFADGPDPEKFKEIREEMEAEVLSVLNDEQLAKFNEMKGEPFDMPQMGRFGGGGRGGWGRGGPDGRGGRGGRGDWGGRGDRGGRGDWGRGRRGDDDEGRGPGRRYRDRGDESGGGNSDDEV